MLIGLTEDASQYVRPWLHAAARRAGPADVPRATGCRSRRRPRPRVSATARACRAVVAARLANPGSEWRGVPRPPAGQLHHRRWCWRTTSSCATCWRASPASTPRRSIAALDSPEVTEAYEHDKADTRTAAGSAAELQGKTATTRRAGALHGALGRVQRQRHLARGRRLSAGRGLRRADRQPRPDAGPPSLRPRRPAPLLDHFPAGLTTQEVAALMTARQRRAWTGRRPRRRCWSCVAEGGPRAQRSATTRCGSRSGWRPRPGLGGPRAAPQPHARVKRSGSDSSP